MYKLTQPWVIQHWGEFSGIAIKMSLYNHTESQGFYLYLTLEGLGQVWFGSFGTSATPNKYSQSPGAISELEHQVWPKIWGRTLGWPQTWPGVRPEQQPSINQGSSGWVSGEIPSLGEWLSPGTDWQWGSPHPWKCPNPTSCGTPCWDSKGGLGDLRALFQPP